MEGIKFGHREIYRRMRQMAEVQKREVHGEERAQMKKMVRIAGAAFFLALTALLAAGCGQQAAAGSGMQLLAGSYGAGNVMELTADTAVKREQAEEKTSGQEQADGKEASGAGGDNGEAGKDADSGKRKTAGEIYDEITQNVALLSPVVMTDSFLSNYYGIDPDMLAESVFSISEEATSAETVALLRVKEEEDAQEIAAALQVVADEKRGEMENYLPEQFAIVDRSRVRVRGPYVWLVISDQEEAVSRIIEENLRTVQEID